MSGSGKSEVTGRDCSDSTACPARPSAHSISCGVPKSACACCPSACQRQDWLVGQGLAVGGRSIDGLVRAAAGLPADGQRLGAQLLC